MTKIITKQQKEIDGDSGFSYDPSFFARNCHNSFVFTNNASLALENTEEIQFGPQSSIVLELDEIIKNGRDVQVKLSTASSSVFVGTAVLGQHGG